jgi:hypothetical protein
MSDRFKNVFIKYIGLIAGGATCQFINNSWDVGFYYWFTFGYWCYFFLNKPEKDKYITAICVQCGKYKPVNENSSCEGCLNEQK